MADDRVYMCIDLKSFYASVECVARGLDPLKARLVVADPERTEKTICLAVTPAMKALGVKNRCRVFEIPPNINYIMAKPRMALYIDYSSRIYSIYLKYVSREDMFAYSIDEVFMDITDYLSYRSQTPTAFAKMIMRDVLESTGISAACGIGSNLYLAKIAMDIISKRSRDGIGILTELSYRQRLWKHRPITDFWRIGHGTAARLERLGILTMGEAAAANEDILYKAFGIDAELLIDHAWGREPTTIADIRAYTPQTHSLTGGQVLSRGYNYEEGRVIVREMAESMALDMFSQGLAAGSITLYLGYSDFSRLPPARGSISPGAPSSSVRLISQCTEQLYARIMDRRELIHRVSLTFNKVAPESFQQYELFSTPETRERERRLQTAILDIKKKYGGCGILRCLDLEDCATAIERSRQIGGHRA